MVFVINGNATGMNGGNWDEWYDLSHADLYNMLAGIQ
jgi:hypothetical protein